MERYFAGDIRYVVETFYKQSIEMVNDGGFDLIGHFDKIGNNASHYCPGIEDEPWYQSLVSELIDAIIAKKLTIEAKAALDAFESKEILCQLADYLLYRNK